MEVLLAINKVILEVGPSRNASVYLIHAYHRRDYDDVGLIYCK